MAFDTSPKEKSAVSNQPSRVIERQQVSVAKPTTSSARAEALKARLSAQPPSQPIAPRQAGSTARREELAKLQQFQSPKPQPPVSPRPSTARAAPQDLGAIEPPPSGLANPPDVANPVDAPRERAEANSDPVSPQLAALAQKERQIRKAQLALKAEKEAWQKEQADKFVPKERLTAETMKVLAEAGITPDRLVELQIDQAAANDPQTILQNQVRDLQEKLAKLTDPDSGEFATRDKASYDAAVAQIQNDAELLVDSDPAFGTIKSEGKTADVTELVTRVFEEEGVVLDVEEAARLIEDKLVERLYTQYERVSQYDKIKQRLAKKSETSEATPVQQAQAPRPQTTLTNAGTSTRPLSARDRAILKVQAAIDARKNK